MGYILALDQGTTSSRAILFDEAGAIAAVAQHEFQQFYPQAGWVEHDPTEILTSQLACAVEALGRAGARPRDVAGIGITNQRETVIVWDRATGKAIHPAIVWQDRRTAAQCSELEQSGAGDDVSNRTGLVLDPYFSATKMQWLLGEGGVPLTPDLAMGTVDSWVLWNLTGGTGGGVLPPTPPTPRGRCSSTSWCAAGPTSSAPSSVSPPGSCPRSVRPAAGSDAWIRASSVGTRPSPGYRSAGSPETSTPSCSARPASSRG